MGLCGSKDDSKEETAAANSQVNDATPYQPPQPVEKSPAVETKKQVEEVKEEKVTVSPLAASEETPVKSAPVVAPEPTPAPVAEAPQEEVKTPLVAKEEEAKAPEPVRAAAPVPAAPADNEEEDTENRESMAIEGVPKGHIQCVRCNEVLPKSEFSANQAKKKKTANCKKCVAEKA